MHVDGKASHVPPHEKGHPLQTSRKQFNPSQHISSQACFSSILFPSREGTREKSCSRQKILWCLIFIQSFVVSFFFSIYLICEKSFKEYTTEFAKGFSDVHEVRPIQALAQSNLRMCCCKFALKYVFRISLTCYNSFILQPVIYCIIRLGFTLMKLTFKKKTKEKWNFSHTHTNDFWQNKNGNTYLTLTSSNLKIVCFVFSLKSLQRRDPIQLDFKRKLAIVTTHDYFCDRMNTPTLKPPITFRATHKIPFFTVNYLLYVYFSWFNFYLQLVLFCMSFYDFFS